MFSTRFSSEFHSFFRLNFFGASIMDLQIIVFAYLLFMEFFFHHNKMYSKIIRQISIVKNKFRMPSVAKSFLEMSLGVTFSHVYVK